MWPPGPPPSRNRSLPNGRAKSSVDDEQVGERRVLAGEDLPHREPDSFIHVSGLTSVRSIPRNRPIATADASRVRPLPAQPARSASRSRTIQPMLWRVFAYWSPGFPRPTTIFKLAPSSERPCRARGAISPNGPESRPGGPAAMVAATPGLNLPGPKGPMTL